MAPFLLSHPHLERPSHVHTVIPPRSLFPDQRIHRPHSGVAVGEPAMAVTTNRWPAAAGSRHTG
jgi:hypothetical protein